MLPKDFKSLTVLNFFAGPGAGKTSTATAVFAALKAQGVNCEYVGEVAKDFIFEESFNTLNNQPLITTSQFHRLYRLVGRVDVAVTDTSLLLGRVRSKAWVPEPFYAYVHDLYKLFHNVNFWVNRSPNYSRVGRVHSHEAAIASDWVIREMLAELEVDYTEVECGDLGRVLQHCQQQGLMGTIAAT